MIIRDMDCYNNFAYIYDDLINNDINYELWSNTIMKVCKECNIDNKDYLDIGCGTGNLTEKIVPNFKNSWCVDLSSDMLTKAEEKFIDKKLKVKLICQNMTELNLNRQFDLITCCLDCTNYIIEDMELTKYFKSVIKHLKPNGIFIFDINSYYKITEVLGNNIYDYDDDKITYIWDNNLENEIVDMYLIFFIKEGQLYRRFDEHHSERAYKCEQLEGILSECGFQVLKKLDNYSDKVPQLNSERIVYVVNKKENN
ncbi:class I SAM-dependent DNA methyltransferase [Clostridium tyrobutyricum]|uniref:class I SAM-dependent DNA methyltransferase n=1 Tax=Clostridium tyrobutyricum TaxID=1519 RepID=UPI0011CA6E88|nr:class I SAM-dependent methyltransferase [Clostridium tyrobutyricum]